MQLHSSGPAGANDEDEEEEDDDEDEDASTVRALRGAKALRTGRRSGKGKGGRRVVDTGFER